MRKIIILFQFAATVSWAAPMPAFLRVDSSYSQKKEESDIKNLPRVSTQDGIGICYAYVAATMMQAENCRAMKVDCGSLPESQLFSPLSLTRFKAPEKGEELSELFSSYRGINIEGGNPHNSAMIAALVVKKTASEECLSLDRILSKMNSRGETTDAQVALWTRLKMHYEAVRKEARAKANCAECLNNIYATAMEKVAPEIEKNLNIKNDNTKMMQAFAADTYEKFLDEFLGAQQCRRASQQVFFENAEKVKYEIYPTSGNLTAEQVKDKVKEVLKGGRPVSLASICLGEEPAEKCQENNLHSVVVAGYRTVCNSAGKCRDVFKVVNSWGKSWQDQNDGGWLDADTILKHTRLGPEILGWFADKK